MPFWQIGTEGGFLPNPVRLTEAAASARPSAPT